MKRKFLHMFKKVMCAGLASAMLLSMVGCGSTESNNDASQTNGDSQKPVSTEVQEEVNKSEEVEEVTKLKMIMYGDKPVVYDQVYGKLNEMLLEDINAEVEVEFYSANDYKQKCSLLFSSGEDFDICFMCSWTDYQTFAQKNAFLEITDDLLKESSPKLYDLYTDVHKNDAKINGKMYMLPMNDIQYQQWVTLIRGDLREKYGLDEIDSADEFQVYLEKVAENESEIIPVVNPGIRWIFGRYAMGITHAGNSGPAGTGLMYVVNDSKWVIDAEQEYYAVEAKKVSEFVAKGIMPPDLVANPLNEADMFDSGKSATYFHNLGTCTSKASTLREEHPEWKVEILDLSQKVGKGVNSFISNGVALNRNTKNAEKALQLCELLMTDQRYYDLIQYGVEGVHWKAEGERAMIDLQSTLPEDQKYIPGSVWGWTNSELARSYTSDIPEKQQILDRWKTETVTYPTRGFSFVDTNVKAEKTAITNLTTQYGTPLTYGMIEEEKVDEAIAEYVKQLKAAGIDTVLKEVEAQFEAFQESMK